MTIKIKFALPILLSCLLNTGISAEETSNKSSADGELKEYMLDEIEVSTDGSMHSLQMEVIRAEEQKYDIFNSLNSTDEFDIECKWYAPLGTRIKKWGCDVGYMKRAGAEDARDFLQHGTPVRSHQQRAIELANKTRALNKEMIYLAFRHPELAEAMIRANELRLLYKEEAIKRYKDSIFVGTPKSDKKHVTGNGFDFWEFWQNAFHFHNKGDMPDKIWEVWDDMFRKKLFLKIYRNNWKSINHDKYSDEFTSYVNKVMSGK